MPQSDPSTKVASVMPTSLKERLKTFADSKRWTMSQAVVYFVEKGLDEEIAEEPAPSKKK